jgi:two-component system chemotaxis sensor kinase CheA
MTDLPDDRGAEMRDLFFETTQELLQSLNDDALRLEKSPHDKEIIRSIRRTVHTLKGDAAACGFHELSDLAHLMEDALAVEVVSANDSLAEVAFTAADVFADMLIAYRQSNPLPDTATLKNMVHSMAGSVPEAVTQDSWDHATNANRVAWTEYEVESANAARTQGRSVFHVIAKIDPMCAMPIAARQLLANGLAAIADILGARPQPGDTGNAKTKTLDLLVASTHSDIEIIAKSRIPTVISDVQCFKLQDLTQLSREADAGTWTNPAFEEEGLREAADSAEPASPGLYKKVVAENILRVDAGRIDDVLNLVGELIIAKSMMQQSLHEFARLYPKDPLRSRFADAMAFQSRVLNDLQRSVMKVRMVPVEQLFRRFPRLVRDSAKRCEKQAELIINGQDTDVDKGLLDAIAEPLTHIVRNAVSHGLEAAPERERAGKNPTGQIRLDAYHQANQLIVEVSDDGLGIDVARLKAKAVKLNLIAAEEAARMSHADALELIFRPGFSTADEITEISGRGVGLDVVRSVLHRLKGTVEVETHPGQGTRFRLKLPLTLAIIKALLFRIEQRLYAIPLNAVAEITRATGSDLHQVGGAEMLQFRDQVLSLVRLGHKPDQDNNYAKGKFFVLVIALGERKLGLIVDALEGEEELVIKALDDHTIATDLISGASILGDGRVVLIMNLAAVVDRYLRSGAHRSQAGMLSYDGSHSHQSAVQVQQ